MALAPSLVDLLPFPLQLRIAERAAKEGVTPDEALVTLLTGALALLDYADRDRGLPPVPAYGPPQRRRTPLDAEIGRRAGGKRSTRSRVSRGRSARPPGGLW